MNKIIQILICILIIGGINCKKKEIVILPKVLTASADEVFSTSAKVGGRIADNGGDVITDKGVYWGTSENPQSTGTKLKIDGDSNTFYITLNQLKRGEKYYVTAYATNSAGTAYGLETFFTTEVNFPEVVTSAVSDLTLNSAKIGGDVTDNGGFEISERGIYFGDMSDPVSTGEKYVIGNGDGKFSKIISGLSRGNTYYVRAFATNIKGTSLGAEINFELNSTLPVVYTAAPSGVTTSAAILSGNVDSDGGSSVTEKGFMIGTTSNPEIDGNKVIHGLGLGMYSASIDTLHSNTTYYYTAYATNGIGTNYGLVDSFSTTGARPVVSLLDIDNLKRYSVTLYGLVNANDLNTIVTFEYGTNTTYGTSIPIDENPITGDNDDSVYVHISGLTMNTLYHYRIKAENEQGITYSNDTTFTTVITGYVGSVVDIQGNSYPTIGIGYQEWTTVNLRSTELNDGTPIDSVGHGYVWDTTKNSGYCNFDNSHYVYNNYGLLYNWYVVKTNKICPNGWHVPTNDEVTELVNYLGGGNIAGGKLKESGTVHWKTPNTDANNNSGFTALPGGIRDKDSTYYFRKVEGYWWTQTEYGSNTARYFNLTYDHGNCFQASTHKNSGMSIRCVKD